MFHLVVRHARWLARVPLLPQVFDALLLAWTCVARRARLAAMETLEARALALPGVGLRVHRLGGVEFVQGGRELGHLHGNGLLDARVARGTAERLVAAGDARAHHVFPAALGLGQLPARNGCRRAPRAGNPDRRGTVSRRLICVWGGMESFVIRKPLSS